MNPSNMQLVRVLVAKVKDLKRIERILRAIPIRQDVRGWNCVDWMREALEALSNDGKALGTAVTNWQTVRDACMNYV